MADGFRPYFRDRSWAGGTFRFGATEDLLFCDPNFDY